MKKFLALALALVITALAFAGCAGKKDVDATNKTSDVEYITEKGTIVIGITEYAPMDYKEKGSDEWVGFDADLGRIVAKKLGVNVEFKVIDWDNKFLELNTKAIDCVWNGMTITDEVKNNTTVSDAYARNRQMLVVRKENADKFKSVDDVKKAAEEGKLVIAVESGSSGQGVAEENGFTEENNNLAVVSTQADTLLEVKSNADGSVAAVIDSTMASAMTGEGTDYADLTGTVVLSEEQYGIGCRKGSDLAAKLNAIMKELKEDGTLKTLSEKYGVELMD